MPPIMRKRGHPKGDEVTVIGLPAKRPRGKQKHSDQNERPQELLGQGQGPSSASWGGEWGLRRVRRGQQATCSKDCLWPYSVGMLRPSWGVPPAQVDFSNVMY